MHCVTRKEVPPRVRETSLERARTQGHQIPSFGGGGDNARHGVAKITGMGRKS